MPANDADGSSGDDSGADHVFQALQRQLSGSPSGSSVDLLAESHGDGKLADSFQHWPHGFQPRLAYEHPKKYTDIMAVSYNARMHQFVLLDAKGVTTWSKDAVHLSVNRALNYPKYEYRLITNLVYARKYNVYFALGKDFSLKVLNRDFLETCSVSADMRCVLFMVFNPVRDELITGGVGGTKVWRYHQAADKAWGEIKAMANYKLTLKYELPNVGGSWVRKVELDQTLQHLYCCSDTDLSAYNMEGEKLFSFERAHTLSITGCAYSTTARLLVTASMDSEVKVWSIVGGQIHTFRGHSKAVTNLILHPDNPALVLSSSLDGSVRMWSLDTMDCIYSMVVSGDGVLYMGVTDEKLLYLGTGRTLTLWSATQPANFWALTRNAVSQLGCCPAGGKSARVVALGEDNSVRLFCRKTRKNLSTVLPPPSLSPLDRILGHTYNRQHSITYILSNPTQLWLYTNRTDPACLIDSWDLNKVQETFKQELPRNEETNSNLQKDGNSKDMPKQKDKRHGNSLLTLKGTAHRATEGSLGNDSPARCLCICALTSPVQLHTDEGFACLLQQSFLLLGLEDGRILFMDPSDRGKRHMEFRANKDPVVCIQHDTQHNSLVTRCDGTNAALVQVWSLPQMDLVSEVYTRLNVTSFARLNESLMTGNVEGVVEVHPLLPTEDTNIQGKPKFLLEEAGGGSGAASRADHSGPVISVDSCRPRAIFVTCSGDGCVKVWDERRVPRTELQVEASLTAAAFLGSRGDLLLGMHNHLFLIEHDKILSTHMGMEELEDSECSETESEIYEDPSVLYEGVLANPDPLNLQGYLVPFNLEDIDQNLCRLQDTDHNAESGAQNDLESEVESFAPTDIYASPYESPIYSRVTSPEPTHREGRVWFEDDAGDDKPATAGFQLPLFGESPGPSPECSPPASPLPEEQDQAATEEEEAKRDDSQEDMHQLSTLTKLEVEVSEGESSKIDSVASAGSRLDTNSVPVSLPAPSPAQTTPTPSSSPSAPAAPSRLATIRLDNAASMIRRPAGRPLPEQTDTAVEVERPGFKGHALTPARAPKKKQVWGERKLPKKGQKKTGRDVRSQQALERRAAKATSGPGTRRISMMPTVAQIQENEWSDEEEAGGPNASTYGLSPYRRRMFAITGQPGMGSSSHGKVLAQVSPLDLLPGASSVTLAKRGDGGDESSRDVGSPLFKASVAGKEHPPQNVFEEMERMQEQRIRDLSHKKKQRRELLRKKKAGAPGAASPSTSPRLGEHSAAVRRDLLLVKDSVAQGSRAEPSSAGGAAMRSQTHDGPFDLNSDWSVPDGESLVSGGLTGSMGRAPSAQSCQSPATFRAWVSQKSSSANERMPSRRSRYADEACRPQRPQTAHIMDIEGLKEEDLELRFQEALAKYQGSPGSPRYKESLYHNDGTHFVENWHEQAIERHLLLKLQRQLRARSASQRRKLQEQAQQDKRPSSHQLCHRPASESNDQMASELRGFLARPQSCSMEDRQWARSGGSPGTCQGGQRPQTAAPRLQGSPTAAPRLQGSHTTAPRLQGSHTTAPRLQGSQNTLQTKRDLHTEQPFRYRLSQQPRPPAVPVAVAEKVDLHLHDPRNEAARALLCQPTKSIPSKCSRYVLIVQPRGSPQPNPPSHLEYSLIQERFPDWGEKWLRAPLSRCPLLPKRLPSAIPALHTT